MKRKIVNLVEDTPGNTGCLYEHGLSFYIETERHKLLMDSGATDMFWRNADRLGIDLKAVDTLVLSHGHYDHAGGILTFAERNPKAAIYLRSTVGEEYYHLTKAREKYIGIDRRILDLKQCVFVQEDCTKIDDELFLFSHITGKNGAATDSLQIKQQFKRRTANGFVQDTFEHEQCLVIWQENYSILLSGCAHSGILNILERYHEVFHSYPDVVISGFHMIKKEEYQEDEISAIKETASALMQTGAVFYTGHCTGQAAYAWMKDIMGDRLRDIHSGDTLLSSDSL
ncbi:MAG: MBL fold metallo-hydrolase [bacterium]|nr:MBL fold metallo-hydrolase [bacterium]